MQLKVRGMRTATKRLADGRIAYYAYAYRGGPLIAKGEGATKDEARKALDAELALPANMAKLAAARDAEAIVPAPSVNYVEGIVRAYLKSPEFEKLSGSTKTAYRHALDKFRAEFGDWRTSLFEDPRIAQDMADWRDSAAGARAGDMRISVISRLFGWARTRGITTAHPTESLERIYKADRSDKVWDDKSLSAVISASPEPLTWAIRLAVCTGLRQGDLISLPWSAVSDVAIRWRTSKRKKDAIIPITPQLRELLDEIPRRSPIVLTSSTGKPWTSDGLRTSFGKAKDKAGIEGLRWHDFRGTAVTHLAKTRLRTRDIARIIGWSEAKVEGIMARYVSTDVLVEDMLRRMNGEQGLQTSGKPERPAND